LNTANFANTLDVLLGRVTLKDVASSSSQLQLFKQHNGLNHSFLQRSLGSAMQHFVRSDAVELENRDGAALWRRLVAQYDIKSTALGLEAMNRFLDTSDSTCVWNPREPPGMFFARLREAAGEVERHGMPRPTPAMLISRVLLQLPKSPDYQILRTNFSKGDADETRERLTTEAGFIQLEKELQKTWLESGAGTQAARAANQRPSAPRAALSFGQAALPDSGYGRTTSQDHRQHDQRGGDSGRRDTARPPNSSGNQRNSTAARAPAQQHGGRGRGGGDRRAPPPRNGQPSSSGGSRLCPHHPGRTVTHTEAECNLIREGRVPGGGSGPGRATSMVAAAAAPPSQPSDGLAQGALPGDGIGSAAQPPRAHGRTGGHALVTVYPCGDSDMGALDPTASVKWVVDTGASHHMVGDTSMLTDLQELLPHQTKTVSGIAGDLPVICSGTYKGTACTSDGGISPITLTGVLVVDGLTWNLLSVLSLQEQGMGMQLFSETGSGQPGAAISLPTQELLPLLLRARQWLLFTAHAQQSAHALLALADSRRIWHERLGHVNDQHLDGLIKLGALQISGNSTRPFCDGCQLGKLVHADISKTPRQPTARALERLHSDIAGPFKPAARDGSSYALFIVDDFTHYTWVYNIRTKDLMVDRFATFIKGVCSGGATIGTLRCDSGSEYKSANFRALFTAHGTTFEFSAPYHHSQNGVAERCIGTCVSRMRTMMHARGAPAKFWNEALQHAVLVTNLLPTRALPSDETPYYRWYGHHGPIERLRVFWTPAWVRVENDTKLAARACEGRYLGPSPEHKAHRVYILETSRIVDTVHVSFNEDPPDFSKIDTTNSTIQIEFEAPELQGTRSQTQRLQALHDSEPDDGGEPAPDLADIAEDSTAAPPALPPSAGQLSAGQPAAAPQLP
jgi:hypothetical protein